MDRDVVVIFGGNMRLSKIDSNNLTDTTIQKIVFEDIKESLKEAEYGIVFGNSMLIKERTSTAVLAYKTGRIKKIIFSGGSSGVSNQNKEKIAEATRMKKIALDMGVDESDILVDDKSNNTFENVENSFKLINNEKIGKIAIITSEFHLKRCMGIIKKQNENLEVIMIPSKDGFSDSDNWFLSDNTYNSGRSLVTYEAKLLVEYAKSGKIYDFDIDLKK